MMDATIVKQVDGKVEREYLKDIPVEIFTNISVDRLDVISGNQYREQLEKLSK